MNQRKSSFPPVVGPNSRLLMLGSLPGEASLAAQRYYAHPQNQFWRLMGAVIGQEIASLPYEERLRVLIGAKVALWDVVATAVRPGSLDAAIREHEANDLRALVAAMPKLQAIGFNGATAAKIGTVALGEPRPGLALLQLPSSSPALTKPFAQKLARWLVLREYLEPGSIG